MYVLLYACMETYGQVFYHSSHRIWWASPVVVVATSIPYWSTPQPVPPLIVPHHLLYTVQSLTWWVWNTILTHITKSACCSTFLCYSQCLHRSLALHSLLMNHQQCSRWAWLQPRPFHMTSSRRQVVNSQEIMHCNIIKCQYLLLYMYMRFINLMISTRAISMQPLYSTLGCSLRE